MKRGDQVQQILPAPFTGSISHFSIDQETGAKLVHVVDNDGVGRFFKEDDLQVLPAEPAPDAADAATGE